MCLSADNKLLISVDENNTLLLSNFHKRIVISGLGLKGGAVGSIKFSPDGKYIAAGVGSKIQIWKTPSPHKEYLPFTRLKTISSHFDDVTFVDWSPDSQ